MVVASVIQNCHVLETIDIMICDGITTEAVFALVLGSPKLRQLGVEEHKISKVTRKLASKKKIAIMKSESEDFIFKF